MTSDRRRPTRRDEVPRARRRGPQRRATEPYAVSARYDRRHHRIFVELSTGQALMIRPQLVEGLRSAKPDELQDIEISPSGFGLRFPRLDADVSVPGLLAGRFGSRRWMNA